MRRVYIQRLNHSGRNLRDKRLFNGYRSRLPEYRQEVNGQKRTIGPHVFSYLRIFPETDGTAAEESHHPALRVLVKVPDVLLDVHQRRHDDLVVVPLGKIVVEAAAKTAL